MKKYIAPQIEDVKVDNLMVQDVLGVATTSGGIETKGGVTVE